MVNLNLNVGVRICRWSVASAVAVTSLSLAASAAIAEIQSRPCPFDCDTENIPRASCKDWREANTCFVEDLRKVTSFGQTDGTGEGDRRRMIANVNKELRVGEKTEVKLKKEAVQRIDVVARRSNPNMTETKLAASLEDGEVLGVAQQVDQDVSHVVSFPVNLDAPGRRKLVLTAVDGSVFVESIHVIYQE